MMIKKGFRDELCDAVVFISLLPVVCLRCWDDTDVAFIWWIIKAPITVSLLVSAEPWQKEKPCGLTLIFGSYSLLFVISPLALA